MILLFRDTLNCPSLLNSEMYDFKLRYTSTTHERLRSIVCKDRFVACILPSKSYQNKHMNAYSSAFNLSEIDSVSCLVCTVCSSSSANSSKDSLMETEPFASALIASCREDHLVSDNFLTTSCCFAKFFLFLVSNTWERP